MIVAFWTVSGITALVFLAAGLMKIARPKDALASSGLAWVEDFNTGPVKIIGIAEVLGSIGLILPPLVHVGVVLSPIAAIALVLLMIGAVGTHLRRKENPGAPFALALLAVAAAVLGFVV